MANVRRVRLLIGLANEILLYWKWTAAAEKDSVLEEKKKLQEKKRKNELRHWRVFLFDGAHCHTGAVTLKTFNIFTVFMLKWRRLMRPHHISFITILHHSYDRCERMRNQSIITLLSWGCSSLLKSFYRCFRQNKEFCRLELIKRKFVEIVRPMMSFRPQSNNFVKISN